ncbi:MAG: hypothetical protein M1825_005873 [Sarcosagium campestre]|nr:MAG: hypothetical protein M1825_005873 [Sarcosagium campestre]
MADNPIDPSKPAKFPVLLGDSLLARSGASKRRFMGVKYNHKAKLKSTSRKSRIRPEDSSTDLCTLSLTDDDEKTSRYVYKGRRRTSKSSYTLIFDQSKQAFTLEKLDADYAFNLVSAPWEKDEKENKRQYPQLELRDVDQNGEQSDLPEADDASPDETNPFDFRHWLYDRQGTGQGNAVDTTPKPSNSPEPIRPRAAAKEPAKRRGKASDRMVKSPDRDYADDESSSGEEIDKSGLGIDLNPGARAKRPPAPRQPARKEKAKVIKKAAPSENELTIDFNPGGPSKSQGRKIETSRRSRPKETVVQQDDSSDDGLTIEMEVEAKPKRSLGSGLPRLSSAAPVSLRSAASSMSPVSRSESPARPKSPVLNDSSESDEDENEDVDEVLTLPPPAVPREEDDDLEAELAQALELEEVGAKKAESESESEEE